MTSSYEAYETPRGPVDSSRIPRYAGPATFARLPRLDEVGGRADVAVVGVPFDSGVSYRPGARFGGNAIREASRLLRPYNPAQDASPFALAQVADAGDIAVNPFDINEAVETVEAAADELLGTGREADDPRRRPHDRAAPAPIGGEEARPGGAAPLRRAPRHLGHLLRRRVHARDAVQAGGGGRHPRHLRPLARRHARPAVRQAGPGRRREDGLRHRDVGGCDAARCRRGRRPAPPAHRRPPALHLHRHRLPRPGVRPRHGHTGGRRYDVARAAGDPAGPGVLQPGLGGRRGSRPRVRSRRDHVGRGVAHGVRTDDDHVPSDRAEEDSAQKKTARKKQEKAAK